MFSVTIGSRKKHSLFHVNKMLDLVYLQEVQLWYLHSAFPHVRKLMLHTSHYIYYKERERRIGIYIGVVKFKCCPVKTYFELVSKFIVISLHQPPISAMHIVIFPFLFNPMEKKIKKKTFKKFQHQIPHNTIINRVNIVKYQTPNFWKAGL